MSMLSRMVFVCIVPLMYSGIFSYMRGFYFTHAHHLNFESSVHAGPKPLELIHVAYHAECAALVNSNSLTIRVW